MLTIPALAGFVESGREPPQDSVSPFFASGATNPDSPRSISASEELGFILRTLDDFKRIRILRRL